MSDRKLAPWLACLVSALLASEIAAANLYRYRNAQGVLVMASQVPPEFAANGYEVLSDRGVVLEVVPPAPTADEKADAMAAREREAEALAEQKRLEAWDQSLLIRYSSVADIEAARDRSLRELQIRVSILESNRRSHRHKIENAQAQVAEAERAGRTPPENALAAITTAKEEIASTDRSIAERERQIEEVRSDFQKNIERFRELQGFVELRRNLETQAD